MRMSDWSSDVCSSDLDDLLFVGAFQGKADLAGLQAGGDARTGEDDIIAGGKEGLLKLKRKMLIARREAAQQAALVGLLIELPWAIGFPDRRAICGHGRVREGGGQQGNSQNKCCKVHDSSPERGKYRGQQPKQALGRRHAVIITYLPFT